MAIVKRIAANFHTPRPSRAKRFYGDMLGMEGVMDMGWIATNASTETAKPQISVMSEGGSGTPVLTSPSSWRTSPKSTDR